MSKKTVILTFPRSLTKDPITYKLVKDYDLKFNILKAKIRPNEQGTLLIQLDGTNENLDRCIKYLEEIGVNIQAHSAGIIHDEELCVHCTACTGTCPTKALDVDRKTMKVSFNHEKCIACEICLLSCPYGAIRQDI